MPVVGDVRSMRVLLVDVDSLRPDHLGCYGYGRETSPTIDRVAAEGVRFENCYASDTPCLPSRTALATCRHGVDTGVVTHYGEGQRYDDPGDGHDPDEDRMLSFRHLAREGLRTVSVSSFTSRHMAYHFSAGFQESIQPTTLAGLLAVEDADAVVDAATRWLDGNATDDDWLLHVNLWDAHHPYLGIEEYVDPVVESGPAPAWPDEAAIADQQGMTGARTGDLWVNPDEVGADWYEEGYAEWPFPDRVTERADVERFVDGYDAAIRRVDDAVADLLARLEAAGVREETAVVVTGDHGEAFGEHGIYADHSFAHPATQRVPMVVSWPGVTDGGAGSGTASADGGGDADADAAGRRVDAPVYQFDLLPAICDLVGAPVPAGWHAESFAPALRGETFAGRERLVCGHGIYTFGRALYRDDWAYVRLYHPGAFSYPGLFNDPDLPNDGLELLHDLEADPHCTTNLAADRPEKLATLRGEMDRWLAEHLGDGWRDVAPASSRGRDPLVGMASRGPFLYLDPDDLLALYRERDRPAAQIERLERTLAAFPRDESV
jgi:arylsulfatase A-like enzyme